MQVKDIKSEGLKYEIEVTLPAAEIAERQDAQIEEYRKTMKVAGFRPGKVPMTIAKQRYGRAVLGEVLEKAVNDSSAKAINDKGLRPALQPKIEVRSFDEGKDLVYSMEIEVLPDVKVADLKSLKMERPTVKVDEKTIDETLARVAKQNRDTIPVEGRAARLGDVVEIDFHGRTAVDNKPHPGMEGHGHKLELGSGQFIPGFEEQLTGKNAGDKVEVKVSFPAEYHAAELAGQAAVFDVEIKAVHEHADAELDGEFAKKLGFDDMSAVRGAIEKQIQADYDQMSRMKLKRSLLDALDDSHSFDVPQGMLDLEYQNIRQQIAMERQNELKDGQLDMTPDEEEELHAIAERRVRLGLVLSEIGRANNIQVNDQELNRAVIQEAQRYPGQESVVFDYYRKNRQALEALRAPVFEDKVVDYISQIATVTDKPVSLEELQADEDDTSYLDKKKGVKPDTGSQKDDSKKPEKKSAAKPKKSAEYDSQ